MKNGVASENKNMYLRINIFILIVFINQTYTLPFRPVLPLHRNQFTDLQSKSMERFLYNGKTRLKQAKFSFNVKHHLFHTYFLLSWRKPSPLSLSVQPNHEFYTKVQYQGYKLNIYQTIATNNIVTVNTNQIKLNTYPDFLKKKLEPKRLLLIQIIFEPCL